MAQLNLKLDPDSPAYALAAVENARVSLSVAVEALNASRREDLAAALYEAQAALARMDWNALREAAKAP